MPAHDNPLSDEARTNFSTIQDYVIRVAALKAAFAYSDSGYGLLTDAWANERVQFLGHERIKLIVLTFNIAHPWEHYGNIVVYMRLKGLVPPSSEKGASK